MLFRSDHLFIFEGNGVIRDYPGNYTNYRIEEKLKEKPPGKEIVTEYTPTPSVSINTAPKKKWSFKDKKEFEQLEKEIANLEKERVSITEKMENPGLNYDEIQKISFRLTQITGLLETKEMRWLELSEMEQS